MAIVRVRLYATVRELAGTPEIEVEVYDLAELLRVLSERLGAGFARLVSSKDADDTLVILLNGRNIRADSKEHVRLSQGDEVSIFPPVSGG